jgi:hypothetical protein
MQRRAAESTFIRCRSAAEDLLPWARARRNARRGTVRRRAVPRRHRARKSSTSCVPGECSSPCAVVPAHLLARPTSPDGLVLSPDVTGTGSSKNEMATSRPAMLTRTTALSRSPRAGVTSPVPSFGVRPTAWPNSRSSEPLGEQDPNAAAVHDRRPRPSHQPGSQGSASNANCIASPMSMSMSHTRPVTCSGKTVSKATEP